MEDLFIIHRKLIFELQKWPILLRSRVCSPGFGQTCPLIIFLFYFSNCLNYVNPAC